MKDKRKNNSKIVLQLIAITIFLVATIGLVMGYQKLETVKTATYIEKGTLDYKVCLVENEYYEVECLNKGMNYVASLIDHLDVYFDYDFETDSKVDYIYTYSINGVVKVYEKNKPTNVIFEKPINFIQETTKTSQNNDDINISEKLEINYAEYNDLIRSFKNEYNVSADSYLKIFLNVNVIAKSDNLEKDINKSNVMEITIPLTESQINITMDSNDISYTDTVKEISKGFINYICLIGSAITGFIAMLLIVLSLFFANKRSRSRSPYRKFVDKIKKEYDYVVVNAKSLINEENYDEILDLDNFQELLDLTNNSEKKIIWTERIHDKRRVSEKRWNFIINEANEYRVNHKIGKLKDPEEIDEQVVSWFTLREDKRLYRYVVKSTDFLD